MDLKIEFPEVNLETPMARPVAQKTANHGLHELIRHKDIRDLWDKVFEHIGGNLYVYHHDNGLVPRLYNDSTTIVVYSRLAREATKDIRTVLDTKRYQKTYQLSGGDNDSYDLGNLPYDHVLTDICGKFMCGININSRFIGVSDIVHTHNLARIKDVCNFIIEHYPVGGTLCLEPFILSIPDVLKATEMDVEHEMYPPNMIPSLTKRLSSLFTSHAKQLQDKEADYKYKMDNTSTGIINDFGLHLGRLGFRMEGNLLVGDLKLKAYDFMHHYDGHRWRLVNDTHIGYIERITFHLSARSLCADATGYHPNISPWEENHDDVYTKTNDEVVTKYIKHGHMCLGDLNGRPTTLPNILEAYTMLLLPDLHNRAWTVDEKLRKIVDQDEAMKWRTR
jgi:hypothetical protein